jgi:hypothetical protein
VARLLLTLMTLISLVSCAADAKAPESGGLEGAREDRLQMAYRDLCEAQALAEADDAWGASDAFNRGAHAYLHEIARELSSVDREATAQLLEAKAQLEAVLNAPDEADPEELGMLFGSVITELGDAAEAAGLRRPECD